jgi:hypothetical protein
MYRPIITPPQNTHEPYTVIHPGQEVNSLVKAKANQYASADKDERGRQLLA